MLVDSTDKHPVVRSLTEQIEAKQAELAEENLQYTEDIELDQNTTNPLITQIQKALDDLEYDQTGSVTGLGNGENGLYKVMLLDRIGDVMARDAEVNEKIYNMLLQRLENSQDNPAAAIIQRRDQISDSRSSSGPPRTL